MFLGTYEHSLDAKGRTSLPAKFREILTTRFDGRLILTTNLDAAGRCLYGYPYSTWEAQAARLAEMSPFDPNVQRLRRFYFGPAEECPIDKQGRVLIPPTLREYAGLGRELIWAGNFDRVEIWDKAGWYEQQQRTREELPLIVGQMAAAAGAGNGHGGPYGGPGVGPGGPGGGRP